MISGGIKETSNCMNWVNKQCIFTLQVDCSTKRRYRKVNSLSNHSFTGLLKYFYRKTSRFPVIFTNYFALCISNQLTGFYMSCTLSCVEALVTFFCGIANYREKNLDPSVFIYLYWGESGKSRTWFYYIIVFLSILVVAWLASLVWSALTFGLFCYLAIGSILLFSTDAKMEVVFLNRRKFPFLEWFQFLSKIDSLTLIVVSFFSFFLALFSWWKSFFGYALTL